MLTKSSSSIRGEWRRRKGATRPDPVFLKLNDRADLSSGCFTARALTSAFYTSGGTSLTLDKLHLVVADDDDA